jgi:tetratricopeptide (TPR) repeat protein
MIFNLIFFTGILDRIFGGSDLPSHKLEQQIAALKEEADRHYSSGNYSEASQLYVQAIRMTAKYPGIDDSELYENLIYSLRSLRDLNKALSYLNIYEKKFPERKRIIRTIRESIQKEMGGNDPWEG